MLIEDYGLIGDMQSAALVGRNGSIDWLCLPRFDSASCFSAVVGDERHGRWLVAPAGEIRSTSRRYRPGTLVLETDFEVADGAVRVIDFMPRRGSGPPRVMRIVEGLRGTVPMRMDLALRPDYGSITPWVDAAADGIVATAGPDAFRLSTPLPLSIEDGSVRSDFVIAPGARERLTLTWHLSYEQTPPVEDADSALARTDASWREWSGRCSYEGGYRDEVLTSLIALKAMTSEQTGAVIAAPTTSLPEEIGGVRNWDYRYSWLRDATLTLSALGKVGKVDEAQSWLDWLKMISLASGVEDLQIMYGVGGEPDLAEAELGHLEGYRASSPVRVGNGAAKQRQIDTYGEVADALWMMRLRSEEPMNPHRWRLMRALANRTLREWREPDEGIWEVRGEPAHFVLSKVMCWVALDRAIALAELDGYDDENLRRWRHERDELRQEILDRGFDQKLGSFTQSYGSGTLDASNLMLATVGFIAPDDARFVGTVRATQEHLMRGGLVDRYDVGHTDDGFSGQDEGTFAICTLWLCTALLQIGDLRAARELFDRVVGCANDLGLLAEELTPDGEQLGNYPQAYTHIALILCAFALEDAESAVAVH